jgi:hypothetical protein
MSALASEDAAVASAIMNIRFLNMRDPSSTPRAIAKSLRRRNPKQDAFCLHIQRRGI